ncbi:MAG: hypothetical protein K2Q22_04630, partial [Cytophagales bacterium]|nr:hypothetical protein [Cytophagales bacterium]
IGTFTVQTQGRNGTVTIYVSKGIAVRQFILESDRFCYSIQGLVPGLYTANIHTGNEFSSVKVAVE